MDIFVYSDESGVFDKVHNEYFVYGGLIFLGKDEKDVAARKYSHVEKSMRESGAYKSGTEIKAAAVSNREKGKLYRSLNDCIKFAAVVEQARLRDEVFSGKKFKQRYLDYVYKIALKRALQQLISNGKINLDTVDNIRVFCDEHTTATNGRYELCEALEQEFKTGTFNYTYSWFFAPLFPKMGNVIMNFCDSKTNLLIRAADITANHIYHKAMRGEKIEQTDNLIVTYFP